jgi:hypothetical protein
MSPITDEMLNKYIDDELSPEEVEKIIGLLKKDSELNKRFLTLKIIHNELSLIKQDEVSSGFTSNVMQSISKKYKVQKEQKRFIVFITSFFCVMCFSIVGYIVAKISGEVSQTINSETTETINNYSEDIIQLILNAISGMNISVFGSVLSIILLISGYYFFEMTKHSKTKLSN